MKRWKMPLLLLLVSLPVPGAAALWQVRQAEQLLSLLEQAPDEALPDMTSSADALRAALGGGDPQRLESVSTAGALRLARALRFGTRTDPKWEIEGDGDVSALEAGLEAAVLEDRIPAFFDAQRPRHPDYAALRRAFAAETDPEKRRIMGRNLERWRWMPRQLGHRHLIVNIPAFETVLWENGRAVASWPVIVGKTKTPTPVFATIATGAIFNPWWDIPPSIVAESVGALVRKRPAEARRQGYVVVDGRYRQRPGPRNSLGRVKLVMPNAHNVYLHDTPAKALFARQVRAFSHGCVRTSDALGLARTLIAHPEWNDAAIERTLQDGKTITVKFTESVPVYIAYFTASANSDGQIVLHPDIYRKDRN